MIKKLLLFLFLLAFTFIGCSKVPAGHVGIKVYLLGSSKGDLEELPMGRYWIGINEELYLFPTFKQNYTWTLSKHEGKPIDESISFQTEEGLSVNADFGITYSVDPKMVLTLFRKYRRGIDEITDMFLRNVVRDALNKLASAYKVEYVYGKGKAELMEKVNESVKKQLAPEGIIVETIYLIGDFRLPTQVKEALNRKIESIQKSEQSEYELREALAEAKKTIATARAEAEKMRLKTLTITPLLIEYEKVKAWNGQLPLVVGSGGGNMINFKDLSSFTAPKRAAAKEE